LLRQRILTGVIGGGLFLTLVWLGGYWYTALVLAIAGFSFYEYIHMKMNLREHPAAIFGFILLFYLLLPDAFTWIPKEGGYTHIWFLTFIMLFLSVLSKNRTTISELSYLWIGIIYIGIGFHYMLTTRFLEGGLEWALLTILSVWGTDTGAYFSGRYFGKHKLWPSISPKKTVEGAIGGIVLSVLVSFAFYFFGNNMEELMDAVTVGILLSIVSQCGDFIESAIKRHLNVKDSGTILPGHGGFFDRFDSMIVAFPFMYLLIPYL
jgi:phosphatidate cytidylyltransferase